VSGAVRAAAPRWIFRAAGIYGLIVMLPQYFLEARIGRDSPPPITHPEYFYGFIGVTVAWQVAFLVMSSDPVRYRALIPVAVLEKIAFGFAVPVLAALGRVRWDVVFFAGIDLTLAILFVLAWVMTAREAALRR
jgi:hypothetical protein